MEVPFKFKFFNFYKHFCLEARALVLRPKIITTCFCYLFFLSFFLFFYSILFSFPFFSWLIIWVNCVCVSRALSETNQELTAYYCPNCAVNSVFSFLFYSSLAHQVCLPQLFFFFGFAINILRSNSEHLLFIIANF